MATVARRVERDRTDSTLSLAASIWLAAVFAIGVVNQALYFQVPVVELADDAVNGIMIENARHFAQLYGNYSRFEFWHPGPAFYYVYALGQWLLCDLAGVAPAPHNAHLATCMAVQVAFLATAIAIVARWIESAVWLPLALLAAALVFGGNSTALVSIWPPHVLLMPSVAFFCAAVSVACGRLSHLPLLTGAGGFLVHGHVAQTMFVGVLGTLSLAMAWWRQRRTTGSGALRAWLRPHRRAVLTSCLLALVFALPLVLDLLRYGSRGNIATILARFATNTDDHKSFGQSVLYFASFATTTREQAQLATATAATIGAFFRSELLRLCAWGAIWLVPPLLFALRRRAWAPTQRSFLGTGWLFLVTAVALCLLWGMAQAREMFHFNGVFFYGYYFLAALLALAVAAPSLQRWYRPAPAVAVMVAAAVLLAFGRFTAPSVGAAGGLPIQAAVHAALGQAVPKARPYLVFAQDHWPVAATVALELHRGASGFRVPPWLGFLFGDEFTAVAPASPDPATPVWWLGPPGASCIPLTAELALFPTPAALAPSDGEIRMGVDGNVFRYVVAGIAASGGAPSRTNLPRATWRFAPERTTSDVRIVFDAGGVCDEGGRVVPRTAAVHFAGSRLGDLAVGARAEVSVVVPAALWNRDAVATLELEFLDGVHHRPPARPGYQELRAWELWSIRCTAVD